MHTCKCSIQLFSRVGASADVQLMKVCGPKCCTTHSCLLLQTHVRPDVNSSWVSTSDFLCLRRVWDIAIESFAVRSVSLVSFPDSRLQRVCEIVTERYASHLKLYLYFICIFVQYLEHLQLQVHCSLTLYTLYETAYRSRNHVLKYSA